MQQFSPRNQLVHVSIGLLLGGIFITVILRNVNLSEVKTLLLDINTLVLLPLLVVWALTVLIRVIRWRYMFPPAIKPRKRFVFDAFCLGAFFNNVLPGRLGDFFRAAIIGKHNAEIGFTSAFATIVLEKVIDLFVVIMFFFVVFLWVDLPDWIKNYGAIGSAVSIFALLVLVYLNSLINRILTRLSNISANAFFQKLFAVFLSLSEKFSTGLASLKSKKSFLDLIVLSLPIWLLECVIVYLGFQAFNLSLPFIAAVFTTVLLVVGTMLPAAPGFIGTYQFFVVTALTQFSVPESQSFALAIFLNLFIICSTSIVGILAYFLEGNIVKEIYKKS